MHRLVRVLAAFGLAVVVALGQGRTLDPAAIERVALQQLKATNTPGVAVAVVSGDQVVFSHGYGVASVEIGAPISPDMLFRLGSTTKMFTAAAVVGLALEGKLDLNAPVSRYISSLDKTVGGLTANQLLSHTSGLHDEAPMFGFNDETALGAGIRAWKADVLFAQPGAIYSYSNPGFWLAGFLAESVSGKPYADVIESRLFQPLGMNRSTLRPTMAMTWPLAQGHEVKDGKAQVIRPAANNTATWPAGSIFSSALDLAQFVIAFMNDGKIQGRQVLPPKLIADMSSTHAHIPGSDATYGYGLEMETRRGVRRVEHGGSRAGYGSLIQMVPEQRFGVVIVANRSGSSLPKLADAIAEEMLGLEPESDHETASHSLEAAEMRRYVGNYVNGVSRVSLEIEHGALAGRIGGSVWSFHRAGDGFLLGSDSSQRLVTVADAGGRIEFVFTGGRAFRRVD